MTAGAQLAFVSQECSHIARGLRIAALSSPARLVGEGQGQDCRAEVGFVAKAERESSPASTTSGPVVPPLQPSSSSEAKAAQEGSAIDEDVKMEDAASDATKT